MRFKETEIGKIPFDWEVLPVTGNFDFFQNNTYSRDCLNSSKGCVHNIHYGDVLIKYGIPVTASYLNKISQKRNVTIGNIRRTMTKLINNNELDIINKIARQSIYLSPYPNTFLLLNWREEFEEILIKTNAKSKVSDK